MLHIGIGLILSPLSLKYPTKWKSPFNFQILIDTQIVNISYNAPRSDR